MPSQTQATASEITHEKRSSWTIDRQSTPKWEASMILGKRLAKQLDHKTGPPSPNVLDVLVPTPVVLERP